MLEQIKELRNRTHISMAKCKSAIEASNGNIEEAIKWLQKQGFADTVKKAGNEAKEGILNTYVHMGKIAVLVEVNCETDFFSRSEEFKDFVDDICYQVVATNPDYLSKEDVPVHVSAEQVHILSEQMNNKIPENIKHKALAGKMDKWYGQRCLMQQESVSKSGKTLEELKALLVSKSGENIIVKRFVRWTLGS